MSHDLDTLEKSRDSSAPVELYEFTLSTPDLYGTALSTTTIYRYTSAAEEFIFRNGYHFLPTAIERSALHRGSGETSAVEMTVTLPANHEIAAFFTGINTPISPLAIKLYRSQRANPYLYVVAFQGNVARAEFTANTCTLICVSLESLLAQEIPKFIAQRQCPFQLYGSQCGVDPAAHDFSGGITAVDGKVITVAGAEAFVGDDSTYFANGVIIGPDNQREFIVSQDGDDVEILVRNAEFVVGMTVRLLAGCDRLIGTCHTRFGNQARYGGIMLAAPIKNPYVTGLS